MIAIAHPPRPPVNEQFRFEVQRLAFLSELICCSDVRELPTCLHYLETQCRRVREMLKETA